ncbi:MAG: hypothetical protein GKS01_11980 [Alphaproteobacteria bacterium]|nr:hypothetical protein [Alphaproteobacteria bacterium]
MMRSRLFDFLKLKSPLIWGPSICALIAFGWGYQLVREWGSDYGAYYVVASLLSEDFHLYRDNFFAKGPAYITFLLLFHKIIGSGAAQAPFVLAVTTFSLLYVVFLIAVREVKSNAVILIIVLFSGTTLFGQGSNLSIALFQTLFLLLFLYALSKNIQAPSARSAVFACVFFSIAILTRIDSLIFIPLICFIRIGEGNLIKNILASLLVLGGVFLTIFFIFSWSFGFSPSEFYQNNIVFNKIYKEYNLNYNAYLIRRNGFSHFMISGAPVLIAIVVSIRKFSTKVDRDLNFYFVLVVFLLSILGYIYTASDKDYHIYIIFPAVFLFVLLYGEELSKLKRSGLYLLAAVFVYPCLVMVSSTGYHVAKLQSQDLLFQLRRPADRNLVEAIAKVSEGQVWQKGVWGTFTNGWVYLFSNTRPRIGINPTWFYNGPGFATEGLLIGHGELKKRDQCSPVVVENVPHLIPHQRLRDLKEDTIIVWHQGSYEIRIRPGCPSIL